MKAIERLYDYLDLKKIKPAAFERAAGISNGYLSKQFNRKADIGEGILIQILEYCPDINIYWLLLGSGPMLKSSGSNKLNPDPKIEVLKELLTEKEEKIEKLNREVGKLLQMIEGFRDLQLKRALKDADASDANAG